MLVCRYLSLWVTRPYKGLMQVGPIMPEPIASVHCLKYVLIAIAIALATKFVPGVNVIVFGLKFVILLFVNAAAQR